MFQFPNIGYKTNDGFADIRLDKYEAALYSEVYSEVIPAVSQTAVRDKENENNTLWGEWEQARQEKQAEQAKSVDKLDDNSQADVKSFNQVKKQMKRFNQMKISLHLVESIHQRELSLSTLWKKKMGVKV